MKKLKLREKALHELTHDFYSLWTTLPSYKCISFYTVPRTEKLTLKLEFFSVVSLSNRPAILCTYIRFALKTINYNRFCLEFENSKRFSFTVVILSFICITEIEKHALTTADNVQKSNLVFIRKIMVVN